VCFCLHIGLLMCKGADVQTCSPDGSATLSTRDAGGTTLLALHVEVCSNVQAATF
jgi:hypothetical protein